MKRSDGKAVLVIAIDAAEPTLVRRLIEKGELPALKNLLAGGTWHHVDSSAHVSAGAVWPNFITGTSPAEHGIYNQIVWNAETMSLTYYDGHEVNPFWEPLERNGTTLGVLDVPFAPVVGLSKGFEVSEWGSHYAIGPCEVSPDALLDTVTKSSQPHPFSRDGRPYRPWYSPDYRGLTKLSSDCLAGAQLRGSIGARLLEETSPELAIIVFHEIHHAEHFLWHTVTPEHRLFEGRAFRRARTVTPTLLDIYREVDQQIARLVKLAGPEATVLVFSLHGMEPARGAPTILDPLLHDLGLAYVTGWDTQSWTARVQSTLKAAKRRTPLRLRKLYHSVMPHAVQDRLTQPMFLPAYDWSRTRAFSLPTFEPLGWIRLNVLGREAKGIVPLEQYDETCDRLEDALRALISEDGSPLVRDVLRLSHGTEEALSQKLPDLAVNWHTAAFESPVRIKNRSLRAYPRDTQYTGKHTSDGFCIIKWGSFAAGSGGGVGESIAAQDLHRLIVAALGRPYSDSRPYGTVDA